MRTAVVMMTHRFDEPILEEFHRIREGLSVSDQAFLLSDGSAPAPDSVASCTHVFAWEQVARRASRVIGQDILRNVHLAWIDFFAAHPDFDAYWLIEYDVVYAGAWRDFFDAFRDRPFDLLCAHVRTHAQEPQWCWWGEIHAPGQDIPRDRLLRGFLPVTRLSQRGFERLQHAVDAGWSGFLEGLIPTLFQVSGLRIGDIGGTGSFVPAGFTNRFYTSVSDPAGRLLDGGTMRFRPSIYFPRIMPGRLYHPVKREPGVLDAGAGQPRMACVALERALAVAVNQRPRADVSAAQVIGYAEDVLAVLTGLGSVELGHSLDWMDGAGAQNLPVHALRERVRALPTLLKSRFGSA